MMSPNAFRPSPVKEALAKQEQGEPVAWLYFHSRAEGQNPDVQIEEPECVKSFPDDVVWKKPLYTTPQQRKPMWIDPNDKTQEKFLPNIGEPVVFCCRGETYIGTHTGGGFQDAFDEENYFNTWSCRWMPISFIEAAHGIKE